MLYDATPDVHSAASNLHGVAPKNVHPMRHLVNVVCERLREDLYRMLQSVTSPLMDAVCFRTVLLKHVC